MEPEEKLNPNTSEEELIKACQYLMPSPVVTPEQMSLKFNYYLGLLSLKQQKKLLDDQNNFNDKLLNKNSSLVKATWILAFATIGLAAITFILVWYK